MSGQNAPSLCSSRCKSRIGDQRRRRAAVPGDGVKKERYSAGSGIVNPNSKGKGNQLIKVEKWDEVEPGLSWAGLDWIDLGADDPCKTS